MQGRGPTGSRAHGSVVLIGFLGTGKSTVGAVLAGQTGWDHRDVDALLEAHIGAIPAFVAARGVAAFRAAERRVLEILPPAGAVISTGAGTVLHRAARTRLLRPESQVFFLDAPAAVLAGRLWALPRDAHHRPDLLRSDLEETRVRVARLLGQRRPRYLQLGERVDATRPPAEVAAEIARRLGRG